MDSGSDPSVGGTDSRPRLPRWLVGVLLALVVVVTLVGGRLTFTTYDTTHPPARVEVNDVEVSVGPCEHDTIRSIHIAFAVVNSGPYGADVTYRILIDGQTVHDGVVLVQAAVRKPLTYDSDMLDCSHSPRVEVRIIDVRLIRS